MTGIHLGDVLPAHQEQRLPTADKLGQAYGAAIDWQDVADNPEPELPEMPGLSKADVEAEVGPGTEYKPRLMSATFRVPVGIRQPIYEKIRDDAIRRWIEQMAHRGYDLVSMGRIKVAPGVYPARDLQSGQPIFDETEMVARAFFTERHPELVRVELPSELFDAWQPTQLPTSPEDAP